MLKLIRRNTKLIIWCVILAFVLWGGFNASSQFKKENRYAGNVFGKDISFQEFDRFYKASSLFTFAGNKITDRDLLRKTAWQSLIFSRQAQKEHIEVTSQEVRSKVLEILGENGVSVESYENWLRRFFNETPREFETQVREIIRVQKWLQKIQAEAPPAADLERDPKEQTFLLQRMHETMQAAGLQDYQTPQPL